MKHTKRLNIHYARMGEPTWNDNVLINALYLHDFVKPYIGDSLIHPVVSTMLPKHNRELVSFLLTWAKMVKNGVFKGDAGLQFSINSTDDKQREYLFSGNSHNLRHISEIGEVRLVNIHGYQYRDKRITLYRTNYRNKIGEKWHCSITWYNASTAGICIVRYLHEAEAFLGLHNIELIEE